MLNARNLRLVIGQSETFPSPRVEVVAGAPYEFSVMGEDHEAKLGVDGGSIEPGNLRLEWTRKMMPGAFDFGWLTCALGSVSRL